MKRRFVGRLSLFVLVTFLSMSKAGAQELTISNNLLYDATLTPNLQMGVQVSPKWSIGVTGGFRHWPIGNLTKTKWRHLLISPEVRHWTDSLQIGHFYGDPEGAFIDVHEKYCVMYGCGVIVYFLNDPFEKYWYCKSTKQWVEYGREPQNILWVRNCIPDLIQNYPEGDYDKILWVEYAHQIDDNSFEIVTENGNTDIIKLF